MLSRVHDLVAATTLATALAVQPVVASAAAGPVDKGFECVPATSANRVQPPPPPWKLLHTAPPTQAQIDSLDPAGPPCGDDDDRVPVPDPRAHPAEAPITQLPNGSGLQPNLVRTGPIGGTFWYAGEGWKGSAAGITVTIESWTPVLSATGSHSLGQIAEAWYPTGATSVTKSIELGWTEDPGLWGDSYDRLFLFVNKDGYSSFGSPGGDCYNCHFVPIAGAAYALGQWLPAGQEVTFQVLYTGGEWWVAVNGLYIGYVDASFWSGVGGFTGGIWSNAWGEVADPGGSTSEMGNAYVGTSEYAADMSNPYVWLDGNTAETVAAYTPAHDPQVITPPYAVGAFSDNMRTWHWGGPWAAP